jgi:hypothetical protein
MGCTMRDVKVSYQVLVMVVFISAIVLVLVVGPDM